MSGRRRGVRGKHRSPRRNLSASVEEWAAWDAAAALVWPNTFADWARGALNAAAARRSPAAGPRADTRGVSSKRGRK